VVWRTTHLTDKSLVCCARLVFIPGSLTDIVTARCDAGARMGENLAKDMISARIGPDFRLAVAGALSYFADRPEPVHPKDLVGHACINFRLPTFGGRYAWEFEENGREIRIRVAGQLVFNNFGLAYVPEEIVLPYVAEGRLVRVLEEWSPYWDGYHLYYPSRRQSSPAFVARVEALRHRDYPRKSDVRPVALTHGPPSDAPPPILTGPRGTSRAPPTLNYRQSDVRRVALTHDRRSSAIRLPA
jgi:hypothetical protein